MELVKDLAACVESLEWTGATAVRGHLDAAVPLAESLGWMGAVAARGPVDADVPPRADSPGCSDGGGSPAGALQRRWARPGAARCH